MDLHQGKLKDKCVDCDRILASSCHRHMVADKRSLLDNEDTRNQKGGSGSKDIIEPEAKQQLQPKFDHISRNRGRPKKGHYELKLKLETETEKGGSGSKDGKPKMSYAKLIAEALNNSSTGMLNLLDIYEAISTKYPYYSMENPKWKNSIRHTLSLNKSFVKTDNSKYYGSLKYWTFANQNEFKKTPRLKHIIEPEAKQQLQPKFDHIFRNRGRPKKGHYELKLKLETVAEFLKIEHNMQEAEDGNIDTDIELE